MLSKRFATWRRQRRLRHYGLRKAAETDLDFIMDELVEGARHGHFNSHLVKPADAAEYRAELTRVIHGKGMRGAIEQPGGGQEWISIPANLWVYGCPADDRVGFLLVVANSFDQETTGIELHMAGVRTSRRGEGHGRRLLALFVAHGASDMKLLARCKRASDRMCWLLKEAGFVLIHTDEYGTGQFERAIRPQASA